MRDDKLQPLFGVLEAFELDINERILKLFAELLRDGGRLVASSDRKT
jgi:hypothetical protein